MLLSPPERKIHPRYEVRTLKNRDDTPRRLGIYDDNRGTIVRTLPLATPERLVGRVVEELERTFKPATVVYRAKWITKKLLEPYGFASLDGDIVEVTPRYRVILDNGRNLHTIPAKAHVRTIWGATVHDFHPGSRYGFRGAIVHDQPEDVEGWTEPRHQELYYLVHHGCTAPWFADFALHYGLAGKHHQWDEMVAAGHDARPLNGNGGAHWLLRHWDREHPEVARALYGIDNETSN
ncbi:hypothetical protein DMB38_20535 [Streptomyces sp. WAC 06738]|uniref:hypothetical protein n=1 Tax=Streptomyces sp. WAC 06738 TaxID=2203210 RepID=UPI000F70C10D|nr:hypothetical protein [Streptomyces sp. WAC 06738]AZM47858.1 hypothetical protein DMB38_20535 [Streptomyces sp. WAC 06738]